MGDDRPLGVFDSGIGGVSIFRQIREQIPNEQCIYVADSQEAPYGTKSEDEIRRRCDAIVDFLLERDAKAIVVACNTASVVALPHLRARYSLPFIGLDPGVKPAAQVTRTGKIGVLTTPATASSERLAHLIEDYSYGATVMTQTCPGLVPLIERGIVDGPEIDALLHRYLHRILAAGADVVVLGCTHYPFVRAAIERICGPGVTLVDPSSAVARQVQRVLETNQLLRDTGPGDARYFTTGELTDFTRVLLALAGPVADPIHHVEIAASVQ